MRVLSRVSRYGVSLLALAWIVALVWPRVNLSDRTAALLQPTVLTSREQRLRHFFGECEPAGYGYLKRVLAAYARIQPDARRRPIIRYQDYNHRSEYLFEPVRFLADPSVLVGIGLVASDLEEGELRRATPGADGTWEFTIATNFDLLTRVDVDLESALKVGEDVRLRLFRRPTDATPMWVSEAGTLSSADADNRKVTLRAVPPLGGFGSSLVEPFVARVDGPTSVRGLTAYGIVTNLEGYRVLQRTGACFTAVRIGEEPRWSALVRALELSSD